MTQHYLAPDKYLTFDEVKKLMSFVRAAANRARQSGATRGLVNEMLIELMLETGLRADEVCHLQLRDLPTHHDRDVVLVRCGKGKLLRTVAVKQSLREKLQSFIRTCRRGAKPGSPVFVSEQGYRLIRYKVWRKGKATIRKEYSARLTYASLYQKVKRIGRQAGLRHLRPHGLRHTFATFTYAVQKDLRFTQRQLGHASPETTSRYAAVLEEAQRRQVEGLYAGPANKTFKRTAET